MTDDKELRETIEDISPPENFDTWEEFEKNLKFEFDEKYSSGVEKNARDLCEEMIDREEQTQEELEQDYYDETDEIEETIEQDEQDIERKEQEIMIVRQNMGPSMAEFGTMLVQARDAGDSGGQIADVHIRDIAAIMSDLANQEIGIEDFLGSISDELGQTGQDIQKQLS